MLGENGTAFAAVNGKFVSFNIASGSVNWTWQQIVEWTQDGTLPGGVVEYATLVTNGDSGVMLALNYYLPAYWSVECLLPPGNSGYVPREDVHRLLAISGDNIVSDVTLNLGTPYDNPVVPILQAQDGTYFGTGFSATPSLEAFDASGNVKWSVPGFTPVMATADGGVIGKSSTGQYVTFSQNGVATGQLASQPTYGWMGTAYQDGPLISQVSAVPADYAESYAALAGGNPSTAGTFIKENPYPPLKGCYNPNNNTECALDSLLEALVALQAKVAGDCPDCDTYVFNKLAGGPSDDRQIFSRFIRRRPRFFDGTKSTMNIVYLSGDGGSLDALRMYVQNMGFAPTNTRIADVFTQNPGLVAVAVYLPTTSHTPNGDQGLEIFFNPSRICTVYGPPDTPCQIGVQSILFHEGLHNFYGFDDAHIQSELGIQVQPCTGNISDYISFTIYGLNANSCGP